MNASSRIRTENEKLFRALLGRRIGWFRAFWVSTRAIAKADCHLRTLIGPTIQGSTDALLNDNEEYLILHGQSWFHVQHNSGFVETVAIGFAKQDVPYLDHGVLGSCQRDQSFESCSSIPLLSIACHCRYLGIPSSMDTSCIGRRRAQEVLAP